MNAAEFVRHAALGLASGRYASEQSALPQYTDLMTRILRATRILLTPERDQLIREERGDEMDEPVELGARVAWADPGTGFGLEASVRTLVAHEDSGYEEWGRRTRCASPRSDRDTASRSTSRARGTSGTTRRPSTARCSGVRSLSEAGRPLVAQGGDAHPPAERPAFSR